MIVWLPTLAVVRDVHVGHDPVVVADAGRAGVLDGAGVDRAELADRVAVADHELGVLAGVLLVLRRAADRVELPDPVVAADRRAALDHAVRADDRAGADADAGRERCCRRRPRRRRRARRPARRSPSDGPSPCAGCPTRRSRTAHISSASTAVSPTDAARAWNLKMPDFIAVERHVEDQLVARLDRPLEARLVDAGEVVDGLVVGLWRRPRRTTSSAAACASASSISTPGITGRCGK